MIGKVLRTPAALCIGVVILSGLCIAIEQDTTEFSVLYRNAYRDLKQGRYSDALEKISRVEDAVKADFKNHPGRVINVLMIRSKVYSLQMDPNGLENYLANLEQEFANTSISGWIQRSACTERYFCYRLVDEIPKAIQAKEKRRQLIIKHIHKQDESLESLSRGFGEYVIEEKLIGDLYRFMGKADLAIEKYEQALQYIKDHPKLIETLEPEMKKGIGKGVFPSKYEKFILPKLIRKCRAIPSSPLGILTRQVTWKVEQADYFLKMAQGYRGYASRQGYRLALEYYNQAQRVLDSNQEAFEALVEKDMIRFAEIKAKLSKNIDLCNQKLQKKSIE